MITCPNCQSNFADDEVTNDVCPICGGSIETSQDRDIARSMAIPKNWAANLDALSDLFDSTDVAAAQAVMQANGADSSTPSPPVTTATELRESPVADFDVEELIEELAPNDTATNIGETNATNNVSGRALAAGQNDDHNIDTAADEPPAANPVPTEQVTPPAQSAPPEEDHPTPTAPELPPVDSALYRTISKIERGVAPTTSMKIERPETGMFASMAGNIGEGFGTQSPVEEPKLDDPTKSKSFSRESLVVRARSFTKPPNLNDRSAEYHLLDLLGEGGMGKVFRAKQTSIDREVAVKMLRKDLSDSDTDNQRKFLAEAVVTGELDHPNIVPIYELGTDDKDELFYSMKRVQGTPWMDVIGDKSESENLDILMRVADAVAFAHSRGVIHRDLKPENIMLGNFGEVLVMDWGLALTLDAFNEKHGVTPEAGLGGTPVYMAPEMIIAGPEDIGPTADVYLLGAILYEVITGRPPHTGKDAQDCLVNVARNKIIPTKRTGEIVDIAMKAMNTKPDDRHQSVREFQEQVREYQSHAESVALSSRATEDLETARRSKDYQDYARALFGYQEAVELWSGNAIAHAGVVEARIEYANSAFDKRDYDLAASLLDATNETENELLLEIQEAQSERDAKEQRLKVIRRLAAGLILAVTCVVLGAFFWIRAEAKKAKAAEAIASQERDAADVQRKSAVAAKAVAEKKTTEALDAKTAADVARKDAETKRQEAIKATNDAVIAKTRAEKAKKAEEYEAYIAQIGLAAAKIEENAFDSAVELLQRCRPDLRNWEWGRLMHLCSQSSRSVNTNAPVDAIDVSSDGTRVVSGGWDGVARIHDIKTGEQLQSLRHNGTFVYDVAFSADGKNIATASDDKDGFVKIWNADTGELLGSLKGHTEPALSVEFSKDGSKVLTSSFDKTARLWDVDSGSEIGNFSGHMWWVWSASFSPDETQIVTASQDGTCLIWQADDGARSAPFIGHEGPVYSASFSPNGKTIASAGDDNRVLVWDPAKVRPYNYARLAAGEEVEPPSFEAFDGHTAAVRDVRFSSDGTLLVSGSHDNTIKLWDVASHRAIKTLRGHDRWVRAVAFHPDQRTLVSGSHDQHTKTWIIADYEELRVLRGRVLTGHADGVLGVAFSPDSRFAVTCSRDRSMMLWNTKTGQQQQTFAEGHSFLASAVAFFPNGQKLLTAAVDNTARVWDLRTGTETTRFEGTGRSAAIALSRDAKWILSGGDGSTANLWNANTGKNVLRLNGHQVQVTAVAVSPNNNRLVTGDARGRCIVWDRETGDQMHELTSHTRRITAIAFSDNGQHVFTASGDNSVGCWNVETGEEFGERILKHPDSVLALTSVPGSNRVLTTCADGFVRLWDSETATEIAKVGRAGDTVNSLAVADDGGSVYTVDSQRNIVRRWQIEDDQLKPVVQANPNRAVPLVQPSTDAFLNLNQLGGLVWSAALSPDGSHLVTVGGNGARLWDAKTAKPQLSLTPHAAVASVAFSPDGSKLASGSWDNSAKIWDIETGKAIQKLEGVHTAGVASVVFSSDGQRLATASNDGTIAIWDTKSAKPLKTINAHRAAVNSVAFDPSGALLLTASADQTARVWSIETGEQVGIVTGHDWAVTSAAFSPDGQWIITGSEDTTARVWNAKTFKERLARPLSGHTAGITSVAFSPDGQRVMTASKDYTAKLWDAATGKEILTLAGHSREVTSVGFSPDNRNVITGSQDGSATIWLSKSWSDDSVSDTE